MEVDSDPPIGLDTLPTELLLHILQYLEVDFICKVVAEVCSQFHALASDPSTWRVRLGQRFSGQFPALPPPDTFSWSIAAHARERETSVWSCPEQRTASITCPTAHYASVDSVQVLDQVIVSGSRDRGISLWTHNQVLAGGEESWKPALRNPDMHKGWVWSFCGEGESLVSGSWDSTVKFWQVTPTELKETRKGINLKVAVLSTDMLGDRLVAGTYDKKVVLLDKREDQRRMSFYRVHSKPVLSVKVTERQVWSLSEDQSLVIYDRAAGKKLKKVTIPGSHFPMCMASQGHCLWVGDKGGNLHLIDTREDTFQVVDSLSSGHSGRVTSIQHSVGSLMTASSDGNIRVFHPTRQLHLLNTIKNPDCGEVAQISYNEKNQVLAAGFSNNTVKIWAAK